MGPWALPEMRTGSGGWKGREGNLHVARLEGARFQAAVATLTRHVTHTRQKAAWRRREALRSIARPVEEEDQACIMREVLGSIAILPLSWAPLSVWRPLVRPPVAVCRDLSARLAATACRASDSLCGIDGVWRGWGGVGA